MLFLNRWWRNQWDSLIEYAASEKKKQIETNQMSMLEQKRSNQWKDEHLLVEVGSNAKNDANQDKINHEVPGRSKLQEWQICQQT